MPLNRRCILKAGLTGTCFVVFIVCGIILVYTGTKFSDLTRPRRKHKHYGLHNDDEDRFWIVVTVLAVVGGLMLSCLLATCLYFSQRLCKKPSNEQEAIPLQAQEPLVGGAAPPPHQSFASPAEAYAAQQQHTYPGGPGHAPSHAPPHFGGLPFEAAMTDKPAIEPSAPPSYNDAMAATFKDTE